jgi:hypothetical protein
MSARTLSHSPTTVDSLNSLGSFESEPPPPGPTPSLEQQSVSNLNLLRSAGQYDDTCFEQTFEVGFSGRTLTEAPWTEQEPPAPMLSRSLSGM